ncbi:MAG: hypothetical protein PWQ41_294 [Bacillota bacterium]|nr:hypothetical protein [Bacillota bacterium]MDK2855346.1 hypothetical protein [Bacillota bacterium]MDK2924520.1 hypothetical protein [Bacillota bacterium]
MLENELTTLGWTLACGAGLGFLFDLWRAYRAVLSPGWIVTSLGDLIFWALAALMVAGALLLINYGQVRMYIFLSLGLGFFIYQVLLSPFLRRPLRQFVRLSYRWAGSALRALILPIWFPAAFGINLGREVMAGGRRAGRKFVRLVRRKIELIRPRRKP